MQARRGSRGLVDQPARLAPPVPLTRTATARCVSARQPAAIQGALTACLAPRLGAAAGWYVRTGPTYCLPRSVRPPT